MKKGKNLLVLGVLIILLPLRVNALELSSLKVRGIEEELSMKNNWNLTYVSPRDSMVVDATPNNSSYTVEGVGRIPLQEGANTHVVIVKDNSGNEIEKICFKCIFFP